MLCPPRWACLPICLTWLCLSPWLGCCVRLAGLVSQFVFHIGFVFHLGWGAVSASLGLSLVLSPNLSPIWLCLSPWLGCCVRLAELVSQFVSHLALSFTWLGCCVRLAGLVSQFASHPIWFCLSPWLGCCVRRAGLVSQFVFHLALSFTLAGVLCPPRWACLPICLPSGFVFQFSLPICFPSGFVFHPGWGAVSASLGLSPVLSPNLSPICLSLSFPWPFVSHLALSFTLAGVLCLPRWACLPICFRPRFVFHLGWGAVSASLGLSPNLSPIPSGFVFHLGWWGCCVRLAGLVFGLVSQFVFYLALSPSFVSPFVSHLALSFTLAGVQCPPRWACLWSCLPICRLICLLSGFVSQFCFPICFPSGFVFHLGLGSVFASLGLSPVSHLALSPSFASPFLSHVALSFTLAGVLCPPRWACLPICLPSGFVFHLGWGAVSASLSLSPVSQFVSLSFTLAGVLCPPRWACLPICLPYRLCLSPWLGCCVRLARLVSGLVSCLSPWLGCCVRLAELVSQLVSHLALSFTWLGCCVRLGGLVSQFASHPIWFCLSPWLGGVSVWLCLSPWLWRCVRRAGLVSQFVFHLALSFTLAGLSPFVSHLALSFTLAGVLCPPRWACLRSCLPICLPSGCLSVFPRHLFPIWLCLSPWRAVSASLGLSPNLFPTWLCLSPWLGCCVRLAGLVSQFVSHPIWLCLSPWLVGVLCPPRWACLWSCLPICLLSGFVSQFCPHLSPIWLCLSPWLGCCVRLAGLVSGLVSFIWLCLPVLFHHLFPIWLCLSPWLGCCVRLAGLVSGLPSGFVSQFCLPISLPCGFVFHLGSGAVSASLGLSAVLSYFVCHLVSQLLSGLVFSLFQT